MWCLCTENNENEKNRYSRNQESTFINHNFGYEVDHVLQTFALLEQDGGHEKTKKPAGKAGRKEMQIDLILEVRHNTL